jgi:Holliday junction resolvase RusA-like endonuclease
VKAFFEVPKSKPKWFKEAAQRGELQPEVKPALDKILKHVKDCAKGIFWVDDKQVVGYLDDTGKYYGSPPRYEVMILFRRDRNA